MRLSFFSRCFVVTPRQLLLDFCTRVKIKRQYSLSDILHLEEKGEHGVEEKGWIVWLDYDLGMTIFLN